MCLSRASRDLHNVLRRKAEEEKRNFKRAREVQEVLERQNRSTLEEQRGDRRCTAGVLQVNFGCRFQIFYLKCFKMS